MSAPAARRFYIARNPDVKASQVLLSRAKPYEHLEDAVANMHEGVVFDDAGSIVAFHERHAWLIERRSQADGCSPRMSNVPACVGQHSGGCAACSRIIDREALTARLSAEEA